MILTRGVPSRSWETVNTCWPASWVPHPLFHKHVTPFQNEADLWPHDDTEGFFADNWNQFITLLLTHAAVCHGLAQRQILIVLYYVAISNRSVFRITPRNVIVTYLINQINENCYTFCARSIDWYFSWQIISYIFAITMFVWRLLPSAFRLLGLYSLSGKTS